MIEEITPVNNFAPTFSASDLQGYVPAMAAQRPSLDSPQKKEQFLTMFYREIFKKVFTPPQLNITGDDEEENKRANNYVSNFSDLMVEQLVKQMIRSGQLKDNLIPGLVEQNGKEQE